MGSMTPDELRALAEALCVRHYDLATVDVIRAADYLRACADAKPVAIVGEQRNGAWAGTNTPVGYVWSPPSDNSTKMLFPLADLPLGTKLYTHPAPAAPQAEPPGPTPEQEAALQRMADNERELGLDFDFHMIAAEDRFPDEQAEPMADSDADYWLRNRQPILDAIERAGFMLMSNASGFWLHPRGTTDAQAEPKREPLHELPPLPNKEKLHTVLPDDYRYGHIYGYTADQMREYARAVERAAYERAAQLCERHAQDYDEYTHIVPELRATAFAIRMLGEAA